MSETTLKAVAKGTLFDACDCYVLDGGIRVLSQRGLISLLTGSGAKYGDLGRLLERLPSRFSDLQLVPNVSVSLPKGRASAVDVDTVVAICAAYDDADDAGELRADQRHLARGARRLLRAAAIAGLTALVDEATGYDAIRKVGDLRKIFRDALGAWEETFDAGLVRRMCQLGMAGDRYRSWNGGSYPQPLAAPFRHIYECILGRPAARHLKLVNSEPRHGSNHHQWLTDEAADLLRKNMGIVRFCANDSSTREEFWRRLRDHYNGQTKIAFG